ncbi:MarR family transcriptional regulator [Streptomyces sp. NBC_00704]|uniref:MarR family transcriptional regulator n=1 Tax=Streptomyces sp. NBC_00704 TaxID=2975809 RepID=UPI002E310C3F|nr:MarR family transcriptional regulator [Streptomyces sp. NBC_00704]
MTTASPTTISTASESATAAATASAPVANARALGLAHYAARAVLEHVLARHGMTFQRQIALRAAVTAETPQTRDELVAQVRNSLKADPAAVHATVDELLTGHLLVEDGARLRATDAGRELLAAVQAETAPVSDHIWGAIPAGDLAAAGRVLALVTERADAELAALTA